MKGAICVGILSVYLLLVTEARVNQRDIPAAADYERDQNHYLGKFTLGSLIRRITARECGERCDTEDRCMGFNYYRTSQGKCELLTHNKYTTPVVRRTYGTMDNVDHYVRRAAEYQCPEGSFKHPYKARCYIVFNRSVNQFQARRHCRNAYYGELAVIPNEMQHLALWDEISSRLTGPAWIGMEFRRGMAFVSRKSQLSPFLWTSNLNRGLPTNVRRQYMGAILQNGKFDFDFSIAQKGYICEIRSHADQELNELCPVDTTLFDNNCYWTDGNNLPSQAADDVCADRGGRLAAFPSQEAIEFVGQAWNHIIRSGDQEVWIGVKYSEGVWTWFDGDDDKHPRFWSSDAEREEGPTQRCGTAVVSGQNITWYSENCEEQRQSLCMGQSGATYTKECTGTNALECPTNAECVEGFLKAKCRCLPGFNPKFERGVLSCIDGAICQASGDPHYSVFDGGKVHYQGRCKHLLAGPCPGEGPAGFPDWKVSVFNDRIPGVTARVTFTKYTEIEIYGRVIRIGPGFDVKVDGLARSPEFTITNNDDGYVTVSQLPSPQGTKLITDFGLSVTFLGYTATVKVPSDYENAMCGICGNYNGIAADDLQHDQDQWMDVTDEGNPDCSTDDPYEEPTCDPDIQAYALERCGLIESMTLLNTCRQAQGIQMSSYYDDCLEDACAVGTEGGVDDTLCETMESLKSACSGLGHPIPNQYRVETGCTPDCEAHSHYEPEMSLDVATCQNPDGLYDVSQGSGEGCKCDDGYILDAGKCVPTEDCGCIDANNIYVEIGTVSVNPTCTVKSRCIGDNTIDTDPISCVQNAECVLGDNGIYGCECEDGYTGDGEDECEIDQCPYPMPDPEPSPDAANLDHALRVNSLPLSINRVVVDPNRPTSTLLMDPDEWLVNPFCQIVNCHAGEDYDVSEPTCVDNAVCVAGGPHGYECVCETGYTGNGTVECNEDDSSTGDPHFLVTSHQSGQHLCYDAHGFNKEVWRLLADSENDLIVNGELFETNSSTPEQPQSYFSKISVISDNTEIIFTQSRIEFNGTKFYDWNDKILIGSLIYSGSNTYEIDISPSIKLRVTKTFGKNIGDFLGVYLVKTAGLSSDTTGIIGQFLNTGFEAQDLRVDENDYTRATMKFDDEHLSVPVVLTTRYNHIHRGMIDCWLYRAEYTDDQLLGPLSSYDVMDITSQ